MKNILIFCIFLLTCCIPSRKNDDNIVTLKGKIDNLDSETTYLVDVSDKAGLKVPENIKISLNPNHEFQLTFSLDQPAYYVLGNNTLFLSPGDNLTMAIDYLDKHKATFKGVGSAACTYLKSIPEFEATGYLGKNNENIKENLNEFINDILVPETEKALNTIENLEGVSDKFKELEKARVKSNVVRSIMLYTAGYMRKFIEGYSIANDMDLFRETRKDHIDQTRYLLKKYGNGLAKAQNIILPEFRKILTWVTDTTGVDMPAYEPVTRIDEYRNTERLLQKYARCFTSFPTDLNPNEVLNELEAAKSQMVTEEYALLIDKYVSGFANLRKGLPAFDFTGFDIHNNPYRLSQFKGKYIYIEFSASYCHACIAEYPHFQRLYKEFKNRKDIVFLTVGVDTEKSKWEEHIKTHPHENLTLHVNRNYLTPYKIAFIPRFVVIDKDFTFYDPFASRPSQPETAEMLKNLK